jgi:hypothetical protein
MLRNIGGSPAKIKGHSDKGRGIGDAEALV